MANDQLLGLLTLINKFPKGVDLCPDHTLRAPSLDLPLVLNSLTKSQYGPIVETDLNMSL